MGPRGWTETSIRLSWILGSWRWNPQVAPKLLKGIILLGFLALHDGTDRLPWNFCKELSFLDSWLFKMGPTDCPETSVSNYHHSLLNSTQERCSHLQVLRSGSLKWRTLQCGRWLLMLEETCCREYNTDFPVRSPQTSQPQKMWYGEQYRRVIYEFGAMVEMWLQWENRRNSQKDLLQCDFANRRDSAMKGWPLTFHRRSFSHSHVIYKVNVVLIWEKRRTRHCKLLSWQPCN